MTRGRKKKSGDLKTLHGTHRSDRENSPVLPDGIPSCPEWLSMEAKKEWARLTPILLEAGLLNEALRGPLAHFCYLHSEIAKIAGIVEKEGWIVMGKDGPKSNPLAVLLTKYLAEFRHTASALGVNSSGRVKAPVEDPLEKYLTRR